MPIISNVSPAIITYENSHSPVQTPLESKVQNQEKIVIDHTRSNPKRLSDSSHQVELVENDLLGDDSLKMGPLNIQNYASKTTNDTKNTIHKRPEAICVRSSEEKQSESEESEQIEQNGDFSDADKANIEPKSPLQIVLEQLNMSSSQWSEVYRFFCFFS